MPAVVVCDHRDGGVAKLGFAGELGLGHVGHADHVTAPAFAVHFRFRQARELRSFHRQVGAALVHGDPGVLRGGETGIAQARAGGMGDRHMGDAAGAEEGFFTPEGAVDELVHDNEIARRHLFAERAAGGDGNHVGHADAFQRVYVGAIGDGGRPVDVASTVPWQERHLHPVQRAGQDLVRGGAPGAVHRLPCRALQPVDVIDARSADHGDHRIRHVNSRPCVASRRPVFRFARSVPDACPRASA